jgi:hypothetical protein
MMLLLFPFMDMMQFVGNVLTDFREVMFVYV